ncbi:HepT-like ribonuclease domain-containing protein [Phytoactinopolyspora limicola]|uniref:HepT-like ribonuclease domain-containing protein n=1 Tax=Phytoactinopolyspora limicola TaxID=2715536 RepID=UPI00140DE779|nr:HepT-like ribonuclease domain-containing protein [Phytoactinopolyspora limicola]
MSRSDRERLLDMLDALDRCLRFSPHLDAVDPVLSEMAFDAVVRNLAVVGEVARVLSDETRGLFEAVPWHSIAGLRNVVVHEYFRINADVVRDVVDSELAPLADAVREYLEESEQDTPADLTRADASVEPADEDIQ